MSRRHPIVAVTGSSGARRDSVRRVFEQCLRSTGLSAAFVAGDSFHKYERVAMQAKIEEEARLGNPYFSHFGPEANLFEEQEALYRSYGQTGGGRRRYYLHDEEDVEAYGNSSLQPGQLTPWEEIPAGTDFLFYEGLHGWVKTDRVDLRDHVDLKIGVVPIINLEWIKKIHRDTSRRGYTEEEVVETILRRMPDYVRTIVPQFRRSDINIQRVAVVDTSDPLIARDVPTEDETVMVIRFRKPEEFEVDFPWLLRNIPKSWMSRRNTIVIPGGKLDLAMQLMLMPIVERLIAARGRGSD